MCVCILEILSMDAVNDPMHFDRYNVSLADISTVFHGVSWPCMVLGVRLHHLSAALQLFVCNDDHLQWRTHPYTLPLPAPSHSTAHSSSGRLFQVQFRFLPSKSTSLSKGQNDSYKVRCTSNMTNSSDK